MLQSYDWPGNVRQLRNLMDWLLIMAPGEPRESIRAEHDQPRSKQIEVHYAADEAAAREIASEKALIETLSGAVLHETDPAKLDDAHAHFANAAVFGVPGVRGVVPDVIDLEKERARLGRELKKVAKELETLEKKLSNASFVDRAPPEVVETVCRAALEAVRGHGGESARWLADAADSVSAALDEQARERVDEPPWRWLVARVPRW